MNGPILAERRTMSRGIFVSMAPGTVEELTKRLREIKRVCDRYQDAAGWQGSTPGLELVQEIKRLAIDALDLTGESTLLEMGGEA